MATKILDIHIIVSSHFNVSVDDMHSEKRTASIALARQMAMLLVRRRTKLSFPEIGELFDRDHTTVMHACKRAAAMTDDLAALEELLDSPQPIVACPHCQSKVPKI